jgi:hypothetical protein
MESASLQLDANRAPQATFSLVPQQIMIAG